LRCSGSRLQIHARNRVASPRFQICGRCTLLLHEV
jgi:hypothetical protein